MARPELEGQTPNLRSSIGNGDLSFVASSTSNTHTPPSTYRLWEHAQVTSAGPTGSLLYSEEIGAYPLVDKAPFGCIGTGVPT